MANSAADRSAAHSPADEDAELLWQATARADALLEDLAESSPLKPPLDTLLGYLREVVLLRISEEDRQLYPSLRRAGISSHDIDRLSRDHHLLRDDIDDLIQAAAARTPPDRDRLAVATRRLIVHLEEHLRTEAAALSSLPGRDQTSPSRWAATAHWYPLTEGPLIQLDALPADQADDAVLTRLLHLRPGEQVELRSRTDPHRVWQRLRHRSPGGYSWSVRYQDPHDWVVSVGHRPPD